MLQKTLSTIFIVLFAIALLGVLLTSTIDRSDYKTKAYYLETISKLQDLKPDSSEGDSWLVGWSKINATPAEPANLVGYAPRGNYDFVLDSSFVRALVIGNGMQNVAILNYELLIVHPYLADRIKQRIENENLPIDFIYFTATHTHSGIGGYIPGLMGKVAFGGYDESIVNMLEQKTLEGLQNALESQDSASVSFQVSLTDSLVYNRFVHEDPVDPYIRQLVFRKSTGEKATFLTYSAHPTTLAVKFMGLSGDYPHYLMDKFETGLYDFALFAAGTVGSQGPSRTGNQPEHTKAFAEAVFQQAISNVEEEETVDRKKIGFTRLPVALREAQYRLGKNIRLQPWVFESAFGESNAHFDAVLIGNTLLISSSGEVSGTFMQDWEKLAKSRGLNLMVTTFNGGYIGYITPDAYYDYEYHEVRSMNWYGPYNGTYFIELVNGLIGKDW
ncbi:neutral/alkaline non-lysosomal ceramidase N-terminal domain-containing protein [Belliella marina]|uniref:Neutral/alkaline non-lysosomal ceramidase N-terminal domain-containing protein n=1 Tax=Belliella marina TaxID=1644146 RepID=A0ABW4VI90_9BACT